MAIIKREHNKVRLTKGSTIEPRAIKWLWRHWLARGKLHVLAGAKGVGKSSIVYDLFATITKGGKWPDGSEAPLGSVLVWSSEDDKDDTIMPRFLAAGGDGDRIHFADVTINALGEERAFDPATDMLGLTDAAAEIPDLAAVLIDPIVSAVKGDSHKNAETRRGIQPLIDLAVERGVVVIGITHFSKGTAGQDLVERVNGSLAFAAAPRVILGAFKDDDNAGGPRRLIRIASNIGPNGDGFAYDLEQDRVPGADFLAQRIQWLGPVEGSARELSGSDEEAGARGKACAFLREMLGPAGDAGMLVTELKEGAEANGHAWRTTERAKKQIGVEAFRPEGDPRGKWHWRLKPFDAAEEEPRPPSRPPTGLQPRPPTPIFEPNANVIDFNDLTQDRHKTATSTFGGLEEHPGARPPDRQDRQVAAMRAPRRSAADDLGISAKGRAEREAALRAAVEALREGRELAERDLYALAPDPEPATPAEKRKAIEGALADMPMNSVEKRVFRALLLPEEPSQGVAE